MENGNSGRKFRIGCGGLRNISYGIGYFLILYAFGRTVNLFFLIMFSQTSYLTYFGIASTILELIAGIFILIGAYNRNPVFMWVGVYLHPIIVINSIVIFVLSCIEMILDLLVLSIIQILIFTIFFFVLRSYAYCLEEPVIYSEVKIP
ncbi:UNVERIFIED_CONTAM: hypothetical protein RMT77_000961 [Armadillidium vulgare]